MEGANSRNRPSNSKLELSIGFILLILSLLGILINLIQQ
jgi:hypothetical protein